MFPLVHHYVNKLLNQNFHPFIVYGGLFPDLASGAGYNRDEAHEMGDKFYKWCQVNAPEGLPLARGIICHGNNPAGIDFYADEYWPGGEKGWCFQQGVQWMDKVQKATGLPDELIWWKSHNFIEISLELLMEEEFPSLSQEILKALEDKSAAREVSKILQAYTGIEKEEYQAIYTRATNVFALNAISPQHLAQKQAISFKIRYNILDSDVSAMANLIREISQYTKDIYKPYLALSIDKVAKVMDRYPV